MSGLKWNRCPDNPGIGVRIAPEYAVSYRLFDEVLQRASTSSIQRGLDPKRVRAIVLEKTQNCGQFYLTTTSVELLDGQGLCISRLESDEMFDLAGYPPNILEDGRFVLSSTSGEVFCSDGEQVESLGEFGYDILTPAIYPDNSLAIAGYYGAGFCRVRPNGEVVWATNFSKPDLLPTINQQSVAAVGSLSDKKSAFFSTDGELLGTYPRVAIFAEYSEQEWIALSDHYLAKLTLSGDEIWGVPLGQSGVGCNQPIVDEQGHIYLIDDGKLLCFADDGTVIYEVDIGGTDRGKLSALFPGKLAYVVQGKLLIID